MQGPTPEVSCHGTKSTCIVGLSTIHRGQPNSGESFIVLQSGPTRSLVAKFHSIQSLLVEREFRAGVCVANESMDGCVQTFDA